MYFIELNDDLDTFIFFEILNTTFYNFCSCSFILKKNLFIHLSTSVNSLRIYQSIFEIHLFFFPSKILRILDFIRINDHFVLNNQYLHISKYCQYAFYFSIFSCDVIFVCEQNEVIYYYKLSRQIVIGSGVLGKALIYSFVFLLL